MKGSMINQFHVGQHVEFRTTERHDMSKQGQRTAITYPERGVITKLHKSGRAGVAEIRCSKGKVSRRLQHVEAVS